MLLAQDWKALQQNGVNDHITLVESHHDTATDQQLFMAVREMAAVLEKHNADINAKDVWGRCPVASAVAAGQLRCATELLVAFGPRHSYKVWGLTCLETATFWLDKTCHMQQQALNIERGSLDGVTDGPLTCRWTLCATSRSSAMSSTTTRRR